MATEDILAKRDKVQREILALERSLGAESSTLDQLSSDSDSDNESDDGDRVADGAEKHDLEAERLRIQKKIEELENKLGGDVAHVDAVEGSTDSSDEDNEKKKNGNALEEDDDDDDEDDELDLPENLETCLQMNLVYQEVLKEKLAELEKFLSENKQQQKEIEGQLSGPSATNSARGLPPQKHYIGYFMKPYFKDKLTGLGPPANEETKARMSQGVKAVDELKIKRWESWQKTLLKSAVAKDTMRKTLKPKLSKLDYLSVKMSRSSDEDKEELKKQMNVIEEEIAEISALNEDQLFGDQYEEHDWEKIANIDFEQLRHADDLQRFWQNYLHPSINKDVWKKEEIDKLKIAAEKHKCCHWDKIAKSLGTNRTAFMCLQTYQRYISKTFKRTFWTKDEDDVLRELVEKMRIGSFIPYSQMSYFMMGRDGTQLQYRWVNVLDPSLKRGPWSKEEDELLRNAVAKYGTKEWWKIRHEVPGRTDNSCRDRYLDCLQEHVKKGSWSVEEIELLKQKVEKYGVGKWSKIASEIPNRVDSQCLHKWTVLKKSQGTKRKMCDDIQTAVKLRLRPRKRRKVIVNDNSSSDDETFLEYVDSDAEPSLSKALTRKEQEVPLKEYVQPEMKKWIPLYSPTRSGTVNTFWVSLIAPENSTDHRDLQSEKNASEADLKCLVPNTVLDQYGNIKQTYLHKNVTMLHSQAEDENAMILVPFKEVKKVIQWNATSGTNQKTNSSENLKKKPRHVQDACMTELFKAITPWIGNVILPVPVKETPLKADVVCKKTANITLEKIPVLSFFMKTLQIETEGCKKVKKIILTKETKIQRLCSSLCAIRPAFDKEQKTVKNPTEQSPPIQPPKLQKSPQQSLMQTLTPEVLPHSRCTIVIPRIISGGLQPLLLNGQQMSSLPLSPPQNIAPIFTPQIQLTPPVQSKSPSTSSPTLSSTERSSKRARKLTEKGHALTREITDKRIKKEAKKMKTTPKKEIPVIALNPKLGRFILPKGQTQSVSVVQNSTPKTNNLAQCPRSPTYYISSQHLKPSSSFPVVTALPLSNVQGVPGVNLKTSAFNSISPEGSVNLTLNSKNSLVCSNSQNVSQASIKVQQKDSEVCRNGSTPSSEIFPSSTQDPSLPSNSKSKINVSVSPVGILRVSFSPPSNATSLPSVGTKQVKSNTTQRPHPSSVSVLNNSQLTVQKPVVVLKRMLPTRALKPALTSSHQSFLQPLSSLDPQIKELNEQVLSHLELPSESFQFNRFLAFPGQSSDVDDWLNGTNGISIPDLDVSLPYLPPCASNIHSLTALLKAKKSLLEVAGKTLPNEFENFLEEDEQVNALRKMIRDKLSANPAYRLLKARFLSCFTMPAFLATINPCEKSTLAGDEDEEEHGGDYLQEPAQGTGINTNCNGAPARHFSQLRRRRKRIQRRIT